MKIGIDARMYRSSVAGIGRYSQNLIKNLLEIDSKNEYVLFMTPADKDELKVKSGKLKVVEVNIPHYSIEEQVSLRNIIEKEKCDLVHFLNFNYPIRYRGKFIVTMHDLTLFFFPQTARETSWIKKLAFQKVMSDACRNSAKIIAVSKNTKKDIIKKFQVNDEKIKVIYEAADDRIFSTVSKKDIESLKAKYNINKPVILYVGQYREHKNVKGLLAAYKVLKKETPCQLVLVGNIPENYKNMIDNDDDLRDTVMPGFVRDEELSAWYQAASVFVFPSFYEGFGLPGLEAMQAGTPVVAAHASCLPEIYQDAAFYFDPKDPVEIAQKIKKVLQDKKLASNLIIKGKKIAKSFSWQKAAEETLKVYQEV